MSDQVFEMHNDALSAVPQSEHQRLLREAHATAQGIQELSGGLLPLPLRISYDYNTGCPLVAVTCDLSPTRTFTPIWLWRYEEPDEQGRHWVCNRVGPKWTPKSDAQVRALLRRRLG
jgi:hypothetical protein